MSIFEGNTGFGEQALLILLDAGIKGIILMIIVAIGVLTTRHKSAAMRHMIWTFAMISLLLLPLVSAIIPQFQLPILPLSLASQTAAETPPLPAQENDVLPPAAVPTKSTSIAPPISQESGQFNSKISTNIKKSPPVKTIEKAVPAKVAPPFQWIKFLLISWLSGAILIILPQILGSIAIARIKKKAKALDTTYWTDMINDMSTALNIKCNVSLMRSEDSCMPMTWGYRRPTILLPVEAQTWPEEKCRIVLLHEMAHAARRDCLTHAIAYMAFAIHWFNPLAWVAMKRIRIERERACDDLVLNTGSHPAVYADELLDIARTMSAGQLASAAAITMAHKTNLEGRLLAILDKSRNRKAVTRLVFAAIVCVMMAVLLPLAAIQVSADENAGKNSSYSESHRIWYGKKKSDDESVAISKISARLLKDKKGTFWKNRNWILEVEATNHTDATKYIGLDCYVNKNTFPSGSSSCARIFKLEPDFSGTVEMPFHAISATRKNIVRLIVVKMNGPRYYEHELKTRGELGHEDYNKLLEYNFSVPILQPENLPKPVLRMPKYIMKGQQVIVKLESVSSNWIQPSGIHLSGESTLARVFLGIDGEEIDGNSGYNPYQPDNGSNSTGVYLSKEKSKSLTLGEHRVKAIYYDLPLVKEDEKDVRTIIDKVETNEATFTVVDEFPDGYLTPVYEEGWEEILREQIKNTTYGASQGDENNYIDYAIESILPFDIAFDVSMQSENSSNSIHVGTLALKFLSSTTSSHYTYNHRTYIPNSKLEELSKGRWRFILSPSEEAANNAIDIRKYYGREFISDWQNLEPSESFKRKKIQNMKPELRFLAWQDEPEDDPKHGPDGFWHPDGSLIKDEDTLDLIKKLGINGSKDKFHPDRPWIQLWLSHPLFNEETLSTIDFRKEPDKTSLPNYTVVVSLSHEKGWSFQAHQLPPFESIPESCTIDLSYAIGTWTHHELKLKPESSPGTVITDKLRNMYLVSIKTTAERPYSTILKVEYTLDKEKPLQHDFLAVLKSGESITSSDSHDGREELRENSYRFEALPSAIDHFIYRFRPQKTVRYENVKLFPNGADPNTDDVKSGKYR